MPEEFHSIYAVVVTYNRLELLKESLAAIKGQSLACEKIIVINNGSTDGTQDWLKQQTYISTINQKNLGGSAGFKEGIRHAYQQGADWIWIMDDDSIPAPDALRELVNAIPASQEETQGIGFICSRVEWKDKTPHLMNIPHISIFDKKGRPFNQYDEYSALLVSACSFVSVLISKKAIKKCGLPISEFFIWGDDMEYTQRIISSGFTGLYAGKSIVLHKTATNYSANIFTDVPGNLWKYTYGIRNTLYIKKSEKGGFKFFMAVLKNLFVMPFKIIKKRKDHAWPFIKTIWKASIAAIFFKPQIERI